MPKLSLELIFAGFAIIIYFFEYWKFENYVKLINEKISSCFIFWNNFKKINNEIHITHFSINTQKNRIKVYLFNFI